MAVNRRGVRSRIRIYRKKRGLRWELRAGNGEVLARGGEPFKVGPQGLTSAIRNIRASIRKARREMVLARLDLREVYGLKG